MKKRPYVELITCSPVLLSAGGLAVFHSNTGESDTYFWGFLRETPTLSFPQMGVLPDDAHSVARYPWSSSQEKFSLDFSFSFRFHFSQPVTLESKASSS